MGFYAVVLLEIFPFMYHYYCKSDIDKARMISFFRSTSAQIKIQFPFFFKSSITTVRVILTKLGRFSDRQADRISESSCRKISKHKNSSSKFRVFEVFHIQFIFENKVPPKIRVDGQSQ